MTYRYGHKRVATLFTAVLATTAAQVIGWPQTQAEKRGKMAGANKSQRENTYASK